MYLNLKPMHKVGADQISSKYERQIMIIGNMITKLLHVFHQLLQTADILDLYFLKAATKIWGSVRLVFGISRYI